MVVPIATCKPDAESTPDAFEDVPDMFWWAQGPENGVKGAGK